MTTADRVFVEVLHDTDDWDLASAAALALEDAQDEIERIVDCPTCDGATRTFDDPADCPTCGGTRYTDAA